MRAAQQSPLGIYLHVPFCAAKCRYCDFLSFAGSDAGLRARYVEALRAEIRARGEGQAADSVFFGGGTPSLLEPEEIASLLAALREAYQILPDAEISMEANPGTVDAWKLSAYRSAGITRLSLGVQSFDDALLARIGRIHSARQAEEAAEAARAAGFENLNLDLIFALPGQSLADWERTLRRAIALAPEHVSFYALQIEEGTPLCEAVRRGEERPVPEETDRAMYHLALRLLAEAGYEPYEISNAAKPGFACRHNLKYWSFQDYMGLGLGAASFLNGVRLKNTEELSEYLAGRFEAERHENSLSDSMAEYLFTGLRKREGISLAAFEERFGRSVEEIHPGVLEKHLRSGLLERNGARVFLTERGLDLANTVLCDLI